MNVVSWSKKSTKKDTRLVISALYIGISTNQRLEKQKVLWDFDTEIVHPIQPGCADWIILKKKKELVEVVVPKYILNVKDNQK